MSQESCGTALPHADLYNRIRSNGFEPSLVNFDNINHSQVIDPGPIKNVQTNKLEMHLIVIFAHAPW